MMKKRNCKQDRFGQWSQLPPDLMRSVFKRLSFSDFERGKSVCSSWYSASRQCFPKNQIPWLILFPGDNNCCKLFNREEKDKMYTTQDLGVDFAKSQCVATYGCWLLMRNPVCDFYIVDLLTGERINLPPIESQIGNTKLERIEGGKFRYIDNTRTGIIAWPFTSPHQLWIDEKTKNYLVMWSLENKYVVICKKGDKSWKQIPDCSGIGKCGDMVYKDHKLYVYDSSFQFNGNTIRISDFSRELPLKASETQVTIDLLPPIITPSVGIVSYKQKMVVTISGDVLMVSCMKKGDEDWLPEIFDMNASTKKWERVASLGEEAMILELGITVLAENVEGIKRNSIYFSSSGRCTDKKIFALNEMEFFFVFDLETRKIERPYQSVCSFLQYTRGRWFFPNFIRKQSELI